MLSAVASSRRVLGTVIVQGQGSCLRYPGRIVKVRRWGVQLEGIQAASLRRPMFPKRGLTRNGRKTEGERKGTILGKAAEAREPFRGI